MKKTIKHKNTAHKRRDESALDETILSLANSINEAFNQSYVLLKPVVDDVCRQPHAVEQDELSHLFDYVMDIANEKGMRLFKRLCNAFATVYPDCVQDYIKIQQELYGDDSGPIREQNGDPRVQW